MPELPEAEVVARQLRARIIGGVVRDCWVGRPDIVRQGFSTVHWYLGATIRRVERHGKCIVLTFSHGSEIRYFVAELGMTGLLFFRPPDESYRKHTHLILSLQGGQEPELQYWNARRFGRIFLLDEGAFKAFISRRFGYDPLTVSRQEFINLIKGRRGRVKTLLMHQQAIAGIGNIYANEILFRARIHPYRVASRLQVATVQRLYDVMQEVLKQAILDGGSSVRDFFAPDWSQGQYKRCHLVYNRAGLPCPYGCGHNIRRMSGERSSFFCPACQRR